MRTCIKCLVDKPLEDFKIQNREKGTREITCRDCRNKAWKQAYYGNETARQRHCTFNKEWRKNNLQRRKAQQKSARPLLRIWERNRYQTNIQYRLRKILRARFRDALKGKNKLETTIRLLGCTLDELQNRLESKFLEGMSWNNYGQWHIDHIIPCARFDLSLPKNQKQCFHYTNLQPLWAVDNIQKGVR